MTPFELIRAVRRRWLVVIVALAVGLGGGWVLTQGVSRPGDASGTRTHVASAVILSSEDRGGIGNLGTMAALINVGEVPARVAEKLGHKNPLQLAQRIQVVGEEGTGLLTLTATSTDPDEARAIANTFAKEILAYADEEQDKERELQLARLEAARRAAIADIARLELELATASGQEEDVLNSELQERRAQAQLFVVQADQIANTYRDSGAQLIQPARPVPSAFTSIEKETPSSLLLTVGGILGLLGGVALVLVLERFDTKLRTKGSAESHLGLPVVTEIPQLRRRQRHSAGRVTALSPRSLAADAYRLLAASLSSSSIEKSDIGATTSSSSVFDPQTIVSSRYRDDVVIRARPVMHPPDPPDTEIEHDLGQWIPEPPPTPTTPNESQVILVVSAAPRDGKTSVVANLGTCFAEMGKKTLLLSCDFHRPTLHSVLEITNESGLSDAIAANGWPILNGHVVRAPNENLPVHVVPTGPIPERPAELLGSPAMQRVLTEARNSAEIVIIDTAPLLSASDAAALLPCVDLVVVVARAGKTTMSQAEEVTELLKRLGAPTAVAVLTAVKELTIWTRTKQPRRSRLRRRPGKKTAIAA